MVAQSTDRSYHSGDTGDIFVVQTLRQRLNPQRLVTLGYSLGGNMMLKWLGELGTHAGRTSSRGVVPFNWTVPQMHSIEESRDRTSGGWLGLGGILQGKFASRERLPGYIRMYRHSAVLVV